MRALFHDVLGSTTSRGDVFTDAARRRTDVTIIAGALDGATPLAPPPHSWAAKPESDLAIWSIAMEAGATWTVPPATGRHTFAHAALFAGTSLRVAGRLVPGPSADAGAGGSGDHDLRPSMARSRFCCCRVVRSASRSRNTARSS